ncbi:hypothetical protein MBANPS3_008436 [Mucor bainieri]
MDTLPQELFSHIILLLEPKDRWTCTLVNKSWSSKIRQGALLYNNIRCSSLLQNALLMRQFNENSELRHRVKTIQYHLVGRLSIAQIKALSEKFYGLQHFQYFVCEHSIAKHLLKQSKSRPLDLKNFKRLHSTATFFDDPKIKTFDGWPDLKSIEEASECMYTLFILKNTQRPFCQLTRIWLNFTHISPTNKLRATDQLAHGLTNSPHLQSLTLMDTHINLEHMDLIKKGCDQLEFLTLTSVQFFSHRSTKHQTEEERPFIIDYYSKSNDPIVPTSSLKSLIITECNFEKGLPIFAYIAENYTNLRKLECDAQVVNSNPTYTVDERSARELFLHCSKLEKFTSNLIPWTGQFIDLIDQHTAAVKEELDIDISDIAVSTFIALCRSRRLREALKKLTYNFNQVPQALDANLLRFSGLVELILNYDCSLDDEGDGFDVDVDEEMSEPPPPIPIVSLLEACRSLRYLTLGHLPVMMDRMPTTNHNIQAIQLTRCSLESFDRRYSFYNYVSDRCYELEALEIDEGNYRYSPSVRELTLSLFHHKKLYILAPLHNQVYHYVKHLDQAGTSSWYLVRRDRSTNGIYHTLLEEPSFAMVKCAKYVTIKCDNPGIFEKSKEFGHWLNLRSVERSNFFGREFDR